MHWLTRLARSFPVNESTKKYPQGTLHDLLGATTMRTSASFATGEESSSLTSQSRSTYPKNDLPFQDTCFLIAISSTVLPRNNLSKTASKTRANRVSPASVNARSCVSPASDPRLACVRPAGGLRASCIDFWPAGENKYLRKCSED